MPDEETSPEKKFDVRVVISSLGNERRTISMGLCSEDKVKEIMASIDAAWGVVRVSQALRLTGVDGVMVFANLDNVAFIEVQVQDGN